MLDFYAEGLLVQMSGLMVVILYEILYRYDDQALFVARELFSR